MKEDTKTKKTKTKKVVKVEKKLKKYKVYGYIPEMYEMTVEAENEDEAVDKAFEQGDWEDTGAVMDFCQEGETYAPFANEIEEDEE